jgi:hypothetical protein
MAKSVRFLIDYCIVLKVFIVSYLNKVFRNSHITCSKPDLEDLLGKEVNVTLVIRGKLTGYYDNAIVLEDVGRFPQYLIETNQPGFEIRSVLPKTIKS